MQIVTSIKARHKGIFQAKCIENGKKEDFEIEELRFNSLSQNKYLPLYKDIVEACLSYKHFYFSTILIDKNKIPLQENNTWNLQLSFAKEHIKQNCKNGKIAESASTYIKKGSQFACSGELSSNQYQDEDGKTRTILSVIVSKFYWLGKKDKDDNTTQIPPKEPNIDYENTTIESEETAF